MATPRKHLRQRGVSRPHHNKCKKMNFELIAKILVKSMFYGCWIAETPNERVIQMLLEKEGLWPLENEDVLIEKTEVSESLYTEAKEYFNRG